MVKRKPFIDHIGKKRQKRSLLALLVLGACSLCSQGSLHGAVDGLDRVVDKDRRNNHPEDVHEAKVKVVVVRVRVTVGRSLDHGGQVVEHASVELTQRDDQLGNVASGLVVVHGPGGEERQGTPSELVFCFLQTKKNVL